MGEVTRGTAAPTAGRGAALAALASTAGACALLILTGLGGGDADDGAGDRRGGGKVSAPRTAAGATAPIGDSGAIAASYPWPALFAIGGYPEPSRKGDRRRGASADARERARAWAARRQARADRAEQRRVAEELARPGSRRAPARVREPHPPARSPRVYDRPRREVRGEVTPPPAPAPKRAPAPRAAPPAADPAPPSGSPEQAEDGEPPERGGAHGRQQPKPAGGAPSGADQR